MIPFLLRINFNRHFIISQKEKFVKRGRGFFVESGTKKATAQDSGLAKDSVILFVGTVALVDILQRFLVEVIRRNIPYFPKEQSIQG